MYTSVNVVQFALARPVGHKIEAVTQKPKEVKKILSLTAFCCRFPSQSSFSVSAPNKNKRMLLVNRVNSLETPHFDAPDAPANRRIRRSIATSSPFPTGAMFTGTFNKKLRLYGDFAFFLKASPDSNSLAVGTHGDDDPQACFKMHNFHVLVPSNEGGNVVVIETHDGRYITKDSENITLMTGDAPSQTNNTDDRFFRMYRDPGDQYVYLKHLHSGTYLSATQGDGVSLHPGTGDLPDSTLFKEFDCTHT